MNVRARLFIFVGYQGLAMIAVSGLDMAAWDALAKAAGLPLCVLLGGTVGPVKAYNSNGLWFRDPELVAAEAMELRDVRRRSFSPSSSASRQGTFASAFCRSTSTLDAAAIA